MAPCLASVVLLQGAVATDSAAPTIWFAPLPPLKTTESRPYVGSADFLNLFTKKASWSNAAHRVAVFKLYGEWVAHRATSAQLRQVATYLKRRKIAIAVETGPLDAPADCGQGVEGFAGGEGFATASRIKAAGGTLRYVAFDEPFFYAALYTGPSACHWDVHRIATAAAAYVSRIRTVFPNVRFGDTEPLTSRADIDRYKEWIDAYRDATSEKLAFVHLDVQYALPRWPQYARELEQFAKSRGIPFGVIYTGDGHDISDSAWLTKAQQRFELYETEGGHPEHAVLQSWMDKPDRVLPETRRTFTNLILRYARPRTRIELEPRAGEFAGQLFGQAPLAGKPIRLSVERIYEGSAYSQGSPIAAASTRTSTDGRFRVALAAPPGAALIARYPGSTRFWPSYAASGSGGGLHNVARGRSVLASAEQPPTPATAAVDGDTKSLWIAGQFAPQWLEIDLGAPVAIAAIRLGVAQTPAGGTVHAVLGRSPGGSYHELHVFTESTTDGDLLEYAPLAPWQDIRYLRIETRASPSWVAWREVEVFALG
jgi:F5/8 type C domain-containing protein